MKRRNFIQFVAGAATLTAAGCIGTQTYPQDPVEPRDAIVNTPIPSSNSDYPTAGTGELKVTYFGSMKCPACAQFEEQYALDFFENYIGERDVRFEYQNLSYFNGDQFLGADAPRIGNADLAVWNNDPDSYWAFHDYVYQNQPSESGRWGTIENLRNFMEGAGVSNIQTILEEVNNRKYEELLVQADTNAVQAGVEGTPSIVIGDSNAITGLRYEQWIDRLESELSQSVEGRSRNNSTR